MKVKYVKYPFLIAIVAILFCRVSDRSISAFPSAHGFGARSVGGRGGNVYLVTNLEDYHPGDIAQPEIVHRKTGELILPARPAVVRQKPIPGSLRAAIEASGPRIVVFKISGTINLKTPLIIKNPYITISGQTAPGSGICLKSHEVVVSNTNDVVIRYIRIRPGDDTRLAPDGLNIVSSQNIIIDHCSVSWAIDENLSIIGPGTDNVTVQWCIISESLHNSWHPKGPHGMGSLLRTDGNVTFHHNLYAHNNARNPRVGTYGDPQGIHLDFRNNVIYNWGDGAGYTMSDPATINYVGNSIIPGPSANYSRRIAFTINGDSTKVFAADNVLVDGDTIITDNWSMFGKLKSGHKLDRPFADIHFNAESAGEAYHRILNDVGAVLPQRDKVDRRIIKDVRNGTGRIIHSQAEVGGWPELYSENPPQDSDRDGMPDDWEKAHGLNPQDPNDHALDRDGDGYTNIEEWLN